MNTILPQLEPYAGKKICSADDKLYKSFKYDLFKVPYIDDIGQHSRTFLKCEGRHLYLYIDICLQNRLMSNQWWTVSYFKHEITIGHIDRDGILKELYTFDQISQSKRLDITYTAKSIAGFYNKAKEHEYKASLYKSFLYPGFDYL